MADDKKPQVAPEDMKDPTFDIIIPGMPPEVAVLVGDCLSMCPVQQIAEEGRKLRLIAGDVLKKKATRRIIVPGKGVQ